MHNNTEKNKEAIKLLQSISVQTQIEHLTHMYQYYSTSDMADCQVDRSSKSLVFTNLLTVLTKVSQP